MHASVSWRKRHPYVAVREVENSRSRGPITQWFALTPKLCAQFFNTLLGVETCRREIATRVRRVDAVAVRAVAAQLAVLAGDCCGHAAISAVLRISQPVAAALC